MCSAELTRQAAAGYKVMRYNQKDRAKTIASHVMELVEKDRAEKDQADVEIEKLLSKNKGSGMHGKSSSDEWENMTVRELKVQCQEWQISSNGLKRDLVARVQAKETMINELRREEETVMLTMAVKKRM